MQIRLLLRLVQQFFCAPEKSCTDTSVLDVVATDFQNKKPFVEALVWTCYFVYTLTQNEFPRSAGSQSSALSSYEADRAQLQKTWGGSKPRPAPDKLVEELTDR